MDKEFLNQIDSASELLNPNCSLADDVLICECFCVSAGDIRDLCAQKGEVNLTELREHFNFGEGCKSCIKNIDSWLKNIF
jgi:NAD(P)H-nitrite reductase large subunit